MTARAPQVGPFDLVVFGATGDLAFRKLFPALYHRDRGGQVTDPTRIIGISRGALARDEFRARVHAALERFVPAGDRDRTALDRFVRRFDHVGVDASGDSGWTDLAARFTDDGTPTRTFYLAMAPELFDAIPRRLASHGLVTPTSRIVVEKPLGKDLRTACAI